MCAIIEAPRGRRGRRAGSCHATNGVKEVAERTETGGLPLDALEIIQGRKSTRAFLPDPVPTEIIAQVLNAGRWAPSGNNRQRWRVTVAAGTTCERLKSRLADRARERTPRTPESADSSTNESPSDLSHY